MVTIKGVRLTGARQIALTLPRPSRDHLKRPVSSVTVTLTGAALRESAALRAGERAQAQRLALTVITQNTKGRARPSTFRLPTRAVGERIPMRHIVSRVLAVAAVLAAVLVFAPLAGASVTPSVSLNQSAGKTAGSAANLGLDLKFAPTAPTRPTT